MSLLSRLAGLSSRASYPVRPLSFPRDDGSHHDESLSIGIDSIEWWYLNGKLRTTGGRDLAYMATLFLHTHFGNGGGRLSPTLHWQLVDLAERRMVAGNSTLPAESMVDLSCEDLRIDCGQAFSFRRDPNSGTLTLEINASQDFGLDVELEPKTSRVLILEDGLFPTSNNAFLYYVMVPRLSTTGCIRAWGEELPLDSSSESWWEHQWGAVPASRWSWQWFGIRLDDGTSINVFQHRDPFLYNALDGTATVVTPEGDVTYVSATDLLITETGRKHTTGGREYPMGFLIQLGPLTSRLEISALFEEQAPNGYWEGYCDVRGRFGDRSVTGSCFAELVY